MYTYIHVWLYGGPYKNVKRAQACMHAYCTLCGKQYRALQPWHNAEVLSTIQAESLISDQALADLIPTPAVAA